jgi:uncharacterized membrane protein YiaA
MNTRKLPMLVAGFLIMLAGVFPFLVSFGIVNFPLSFQEEVIGGITFFLGLWVLSFGFNKNM